MTVSLLDIFKSFLGTGMVSFGGAMPHVQRLVVETKGWMTADEFAETLGLCQFIPGPNATNVSICVGQKLKGAAGAVTAAIGLLFFPICFAIAVASLFALYADSALVHQVTKGMALVGCGLLLSTGLKLVQGIKKNKTQAWMIIGAVLLVAGLLNVSLWIVMSTILTGALLNTWLTIRRTKHAAT